MNKFYYRTKWYEIYQLRKMFPKGGEKVRPYLEVKVVKVKKCEHGQGWTLRKKYSSRLCPECGKVVVIMGKGKEEPKGNWVNGENLDKIKFPCFCRWNNNGWIGMLIKDWKDDKNIYTLVRVDQQTNKNHTYGSFKDLKRFIKAYDIHILKGKIILFEEE